MQIFSLRVLETNYTYIIKVGNAAVVVDPGEFEPVRDFLQGHSLTILATVLTHKHWDHIQGVEALVAYQPHPVYGGDHEDFPFEVVPVSDSEVVALGGLKMKCFHLPGHTMGACGFLIDGCLFTGDVLFGAGMGRLFEGGAEDMLSGLDKICALPSQTKIYFGHEYTLTNLGFASVVEPDNQAISERLSQVMNQADLQTTPSTLQLEKATNPFLRIDEMKVQQAISQQVSETLDHRADYLRVLRQWKNAYDDGGHMGSVA